MRRALLIAALAGATLPATAHAADYAPVDRPGPPLGVSQATLDSSLDCRETVQGAPVTPVLLIHGTGSDPEHNFSWNWQPALDALGIPWCTVALPDSGMDDVQRSAEHVVNAIRTMHQRAGRKVSVIGHSQGGMIPRWALRFWPDTRPMVDDVIGFAPSNHGTDSAQLTCIPDCAPGVWQQRSDSEFIAALNSFQETFAGISYSQIYTRTDAVVTPNLDDTGSSSLHTGDGAISNVAIQDVCPTDPNEHLGIGTVSNTAYAIAIDALSNPGPADPARIQADVCLQPLMPGVNPATVVTDMAAAGADLAQMIATYPHVPTEPAQRCYVLAAGCPEGDPGSVAGGPDPSVTQPPKKKAKKKKPKRKKKGKRKRRKR